jgi:hypothetical protein
MERGDVAEAMMILLERGEPVTVRSIREVLGQGSFRDISEHLKTLMGDEDEETPEERPSACVQDAGRGSVGMPTDLARTSVPVPGQDLAPEVLPFHELAQHVQALYDSGMPLEQIVARLEAEGVPPVLGARQWDKFVIDRTLTYHASQRRAGLQA